MIVLLLPDSSGALESGGGRSEGAETASGLHSEGI